MARKGTSPQKRIDSLVALAIARAHGSGSGAAAVPTNDIFGLGEDGAVIVSANTPNFVGGDYTTFTLNAGITASAADNRPILVRATTSITINGTLDGSGHIVAGLAGPTMGLVGQQLFQAGGSGGGGGGNTTAAGADGGIADNDPGSVAVLVAGGFVPKGYPLGTFSNFGAAGTGGPANSGGGSAGAPVAATLGTPALQAFTDLQRIRTGVVVEMILGGCPGAVGLPGGDGGNGAGGNAGGAGGSGNLGGNGGASIYLVAPQITFGAGAQLLSNGGNGGAATNGGAGTPGGAGNGAGGGGGGGSGGQGGSGGVIAVLYGTSITGAPTTSAAGGAGGAAGTHGAGGAAGGVEAGGNGSDGLAGLAGSAGFVFIRQIGHK